MLSLTSDDDDAWVYNKFFPCHWRNCTIKAVCKFFSNIKKNIFLEPFDNNRNGVVRHWSGAHERLAHKRMQAFTNALSVFVLLIYFLLFIFLPRAFKMLRANDVTPRKYDTHVRIFWQISEKVYRDFSLYFPVDSIVIKYSSGSTLYSNCFTPLLLSTASNYTRWGKAQPRKKPLFIEVST